MATNSKIKETATFTVMPGNFKWVPVSCYESVLKFGVMPADDDAVKAIREMYATDERKKAHVVIRVTATSGKVSFMEMPHDKHGNAWIWTYGAASKKQMIARLNRLYNSVTEVKW